MQLTHVLATFLLTAGSALAAPPACFLAVLNTQTNPSDVKGICQSSAAAMQKSIYSMCSTSDQSAAFSAFADTCKAQGVTVPTPSPSGSSSTKGSGNSTTNGTSSSSTRNGSGQLTTGVLSVFVAGFIGAATFVL